MYRFLPIALLSAALSFAQDKAPGYPGKGDTAVVRITRTVHDSPLSRRGVFYRAGREMGTLTPGEKVVVTDEASIRTVAGEQKWLYIKDSNKRLEGWIYAGDRGNDQTLVNAKHERGRE